MHSAGDNAGCISDIRDIPVLQESDEPAEGLHGRQRETLLPGRALNYESEQFWKSILNVLLIC